jgi:Recombination endonuclease VII
MRNICKVNGCNNYVFGHGYCNMHYKRWKKTGDPGPATTLIRTDCSVVDCPEPHTGLGFCDTHLTRFKTTGKIPTTPIRRYGAPHPECSRKFCSEESLIKGLCQRHYSRKKVYSKYEPGFTWDRYDELWDLQNGNCAICSSELIWDSKLTHVDHSHSENKVRGLLCSLCNQGLGSFRDNVDFIKSAVLYLQR